MNARVTLTVDGDIEGMMAVEGSHNLLPVTAYDYGGCRFEDAPAAVEDAMEQIVAEILALAGLDPAERTRERAHKIWEAIDRAGPTARVLGALRGLLAELATHHSCWDMHRDVIAAAVRAKKALTAHDRQGAGNGA